MNDPSGKKKRPLSLSSLIRQTIEAQGGKKKVSTTKKGKNTSLGRRGRRLALARRRLGRRHGRPELGRHLVRLFEHGRRVAQHVARLGEKEEARKRGGCERTVSHSIHPTSLPSPPPPPPPSHRRLQLLGRQRDAPLFPVVRENQDFDFVPHRQRLFNIRDVVVRDLGHVQQAVDAAAQVDEGAVDLRKRGGGRWGGGERGCGD